MCHGGIVYGNDIPGEKDYFKWVDVAEDIHLTSEEYSMALYYSELISDEEYH